MHTLFLLFLGMGLGLGAAVPIGPVNVEIARRTLQRGRPAGLALGFGAVTVDVLFAVATSLGLGRLVTKEQLSGPFGYVGVAVCFVLAAGSLYAGYRAWKHGVDEPDAATDRTADAGPRGLAADYAVGFGMTALNLYTWIWWLLTVPNLVAQQAGESATRLPIIYLGVFIAASGWVVAFTTMINKLRRFASRRWHIGADLAGGVLLIGFGFYALWRLVGRPL
ncbi:MAG TPA: LysE family transporter [Tepidisphaeraceae bacterium]